MSPDAPQNPANILRAQNFPKTRCIMTRGQGAKTRRPNRGDVERAEKKLSTRATTPIVENALIAHRLPPWQRPICHLPFCHVPFAIRHLAFVNLQPTTLNPVRPSGSLWKPPEG